MSLFDNVVSNIWTAELGLLVNAKNWQILINISLEFALASVLDQPRSYYARKQLLLKQLLLSARLSHGNSVRPSVRPSVCLSHGWISQKRCKL